MKNRPDKIGTELADKYLGHEDNIRMGIYDARYRYYQWLREWYGLHFPELEKLVDDSAYLNLIAEHGSRDNIIQSRSIEDMKSSGADLSINDKKAVQQLTELAQSIKETTEELK